LTELILLIIANPSLVYLDVCSRAFKTKFKTTYSTQLWVSSTSVISWEIARVFWANLFHFGKKIWHHHSILYE